MYAGGALLSVLWLVPFFSLLQTLDPALLILGFVVGLGILYPARLAPQAAYFAELFDTRTRLSGFAFAREIGSVLTGGFLPLIATALIAASGHWWVIVVYLGVLTALTLVALAYGPETSRREIIGAGGAKALEPQSTQGASTYSAPAARSR
ncbi:Major facilitator superfamily MFS_1 [Mycobacteroides abscessus subsp. abscessus]|nr:major facilitator transporter domain protein [Mycobacteroides abscessus 4S-0303]EIT93077.1 major facilitator transporter domain protein [Mycobacteroides abscessus 4S-0726-RB]EIT96621.1 major facilitator transporter domain protein [Mycobacteroides abscessus 4S-0726-RA]EIV16238.1 major facilitator transporter domain protein [Mycobacteroides abscessus 4S-0206]EIV51030.1 major facilitator transporter domain protein [Mycobacteroides abscessus 4S-0116-R]EIV61054.1 major facilitator transporter do